MEIYAHIVNGNECISSTYLKELSESISVMDFGRNKKEKVRIG